jgi:hypothetical protein
VKLRNLKSSGLQEFRRRDFFARTVTLSFATGFLGNFFLFLQPENTQDRKEVAQNYGMGCIELEILGTLQGFDIFDFVRIFGFQEHREDKKEKKLGGLSGSLDFFFSVTPRVAKGLDERRDEEFAHETFQSKSGSI